MNKLYYPVLFHPEETGFSITVPDLDGCFTQGDTLEDALNAVQDAIGLYLDGMPELPPASAPGSVRAQGSDFMMVVAFDPLAYKRRHDTKAVKKTLTVPSWLNEAAEAAHINFSSVLQSGLKKQLNIE